MKKLCDGWMIVLDAWPQPLLTVGMSDYDDFYDDDEDFLEDEDEDEGEDEGRKRERERGKRLVERLCEGVGPHQGEGDDGEGDQEGHCERQDGKAEAHSNPRGDELGDALGGECALSEVQTDHRSQPFQIAGPLVREHGIGGLRDGIPHDQLGPVTRHDQHDGIDDHRDDQERQDQ